MNNTKHTPDEILFIHGKTKKEIRGYPDDQKFIPSHIFLLAIKDFGKQQNKELLQALKEICELPQTIGHAYQMQDIAKSAIKKASQ